MRAALRDQLQGARSFIRRDLGRIPLVLAAVFLAACVVFYLTCVMNPDATALLLEALMGMFAQSGAMDGSGRLSFLGLLLNNWMAMLFCVLYGFVPFLFLPVMALLSNATVLGLLGATYTLSGIPASVFLAALLPHGIFELPALILAASMGTALCRNLIRIILKNGKAVPMVDFLTGLLQTMLLLIFPLVLVSALVELWITPLVVGLFL